MASSTWWVWVWVNSRSWWWTGRPGVLWFMGSQRVGHNWATELTELKAWETINTKDTDKRESRRMSQGLGKESQGSSNIYCWGGLARKGSKNRLARRLGKEAWYQGNQGKKAFKERAGNSSVVQRLELYVFTAESEGSSSVWGTKILQALQCGQEKKERERERMTSCVQGSWEIKEGWSCTMPIGFINVISDLTGSLFCWVMGRGDTAWNRVKCEQKVGLWNQWVQATLLWSLLWKKRD